MNKFVILAFLVCIAASLCYADGDNVDFNDAELEQLDEEFKSLDRSGQKTACRKLFEVIGPGKKGEGRPKNPTPEHFKELLSKVKVNWDYLDDQAKACFAHIYRKLTKKEEDEATTTTETSQ